VALVAAAMAATMGTEAGVLAQGPPACLDAPELLLGGCSLPMPAALPAPRLGALPLPLAALALAPLELLAARRPPPAALAPPPDVAADAGGTAKAAKGPAEAPQGASDWDCGTAGRILSGGLCLPEVPAAAATSLHCLTVLSGELFSLDVPTAATTSFTVLSKRASRLFASTAFCSSHTVVS